jgi:hypothetical protein
MSTFFSSQKYPSAGRTDYPRAFKKRLDRGADVVASLGSDALLVIVVDAADNSIAAARTQSPPEKSFVHEFAAIGDLPTNVRLVMTSRTGRLASLGFPGMRRPCTCEDSGVRRREHGLMIFITFQAAILGYRTMQSSTPGRRKQTR